MPETMESIIFISSIAESAFFAVNFVHTNTKIWIDVSLIFNGFLSSKKND